jgi:signal transduction histidine kinase
VQVAVSSEAGKAVIRVIDGGTGIAAAELPHVFDSFFRAQHGDRVVPGTGLGLAIARGLVEVMGGTVSAASPVPQGWAGSGRGTLVTITLPALP